MRLPPPKIIIFNLTLNMSYCDAGRSFTHRPYGVLFSTMRDVSYTARGPEWNRNNVLLEVDLFGSIVDSRLLSCVFVLSVCVVSYLPLLPLPPQLRHIYIFTPPTPFPNVFFSPRTPLITSLLSAFSFVGLHSRHSPSSHRLFNPTLPRSFSFSS